MHITVNLKSGKLKFKSSHSLIYCWSKSVDATHHLTSSNVTCVLQDNPNTTPQQLAAARMAPMATVDRLNALQFLRGIAAKYGGSNAADAAHCYEELNALKFSGDPRNFLVKFYSLLERLETRLGRPGRSDLAPTIKYRIAKFSYVSFNQKWY